MKHLTDVQSEDLKSLLERLKDLLLDYGHDDNDDFEDIDYYLEIL